jgi:membrane-associated phospholipid phosphatase
VRPTRSAGRAAGTARGSLRARIVAADQAIFARVSATDSAVLDQVMPRLSLAANHSVLWIGIAAGLAATRDQRARRAALRGMASVVIASTASNVIGKGLTRRVRPAQAVRPARRLARAPRTTSFPSGHAASAAAFATGVALEVPGLALPLGALAAAVGASRVVTGMHFPSDVAAGLATGGAAGALTLRWWPLRQAEPAEAVRPRRRAPSSRPGRG